MNVSLNTQLTKTNFPNTKSYNVKAGADFSDFAQSAKTNLSSPSLVETYWNITDSMSRENQLSFTASVIANRIMTQGITDENESFIRNISNRFNADELEALKSEVQNLASKNMFDVNEIETFLQSFDSLVQSQKGAGQIGGLQTLPQFKRSNDVFFRATMLQENN